MRYYITGASGFIGKRLVSRLKDHEVICIPHTEIIDFRPDIVDYCFIHLSAYGNHYHQKDIISYIESNIFDLCHLMTVCSADKHCQRLINVSTSAIQLKTQTLYTTSKLFGELMLKAGSDPRFVSVRPYSVYGSGEADHRFIPKVIHSLITGESMLLDEHAVHDWIHVDDFISAMLAGYRMIGSGKAHKNIEIVNMLEEISGQTLNYEPAQMRVYDSDDWRCETGVLHRPLYEGLKQTFEYYAGVKTEQ